MAVLERYDISLFSIIGSLYKSRFYGVSQFYLFLAFLPVMVTIILLIVPFISPVSPMALVGIPFTPPLHNGLILGTDSVGRGEFTRILYGMRESWFAALGVIAIGIFFGTVVGGIAGITGGWLDGLLMRLTDVFLALPAPVLAIAVVSALGPGLLNTLIGISIVWWPFYARITRGEVKAIAVRAHVDAARLAGVGSIRRALRHILPAAIPALLITASLDICNLVLTLAILSFLGLGAPAPAPELGSMSARNLTYLLSDSWTAIAPAVGVAVLAMIGNISGDALRQLIRDR